MQSYLKSLATVGIVAFFLCPNLRGNAQSNPSGLFQRLQIDSSTDDAETQLLRNAKTDPETRTYLALHLPELINKGPKNNARPWVNAVKLAGELKIPEAVPSLIPWIGQGGDPSEPIPLTMSSYLRLEMFPAAKSLAQIGNPSVPAVTKVLDKGSRDEKYFAVYILMQIDSPDAMRALETHLQKESDPRIKDLIESVLSSGSKQQ